MEFSSISSAYTYEKCRYDNYCVYNYIVSRECLEISSDDDQQDLSYDPIIPIWLAWCMSNQILQQTRP